MPKEKAKESKRSVSTLAYFIESLDIVLVDQGFGYQLPEGT